MNEINNNLWVSDIQGAREQSTGRFDCVITVCQDEISDNVGCEYHHFNMNDGEGTEYGGDDSFELFETASDTLLNALNKNKTVLIHCHMGQSRSVSVAVAALAVHEDITF